MKVALIGYGKMGKQIEKILQSRNHYIELIIEKDNFDDFTPQNLKAADVAIEFSQPENAFDNCKRCLEAGIPILSGTTGWDNKVDEIKRLCIEKNGTFFRASNFSLGVNLFFRLNRYLAELMKPYSEFDVRLTETHHTEKKDSPSGTALTLAKDLIAISDTKKNYVNNETDDKEILPVISLRKVNIPGIHTITYESETDIVEITHSAKSRVGFALGAVLAAEFIVDKKGIFSMDDMLKI